jgi:hypothetical protein
MSIDIKHWSPSIISGLREAFVQRDDFERFLRNELRKELQDYVGNVGYRVQLHELVTIAYEENWLETLIRTAAEKRPHWDALQKLTLIFIAGSDDAENNLYYNHVFLIGQRPFVNRIRLRQLLQAMFHSQQEAQVVDGVRSRLLLIQGESKTGLSYTYQYLDHLGKKSGFTAIEINIKRDFVQYDFVSAMHLAQHLANKFELNYRFAELSEWETFQYPGFLNLLAQNLKERQQKLVFFFDNLDDPPLLENGKEFIRDLARTIDETLENVYMVVVHPRKYFPLDLLSNCHGDTTGSFFPGDMRTFFGNFYDEYSRLVDNPLPQSREAFIENSLDLLQQKADLGTVPNVKAVGEFISSYCQYILKNGIDNES